MMSLGESQFLSPLQQGDGASPMDWLRCERINQAKRLLAETAERIESVAASVGYPIRSNFSRDFKKLAGVSPRMYRRQEQALHAGSPRLLPQP